MAIDVNNVNWFSIADALCLLLRFTGRKEKCAEKLQAEKKQQKINFLGNRNSVLRILLVVIDVINDKVAKNGLNVHKSGIGAVSKSLWLP